MTKDKILLLFLILLGIAGCASNQMALDDTKQSPVENTTVVKTVKEYVQSNAY